MAGEEVAVRLLGPVEVWRSGTAVAAGGPTQRAVLAMLALRLGEPVSVDSLADGIWGESDEPLGSDKAVRVHVSRLRAMLPAGDGQRALETVSGGYRLTANGVSVDTDRFDELLAAGRRQLAAGDTPDANRSLAAALALWRGPALMDVRDFPFATQVALRYDELRVDAAEELFEARLATGQHQALVPELKELISEHPYRERLHRQLMLALYRAGQQAAALDAYQAARTRLVLDLGVEPGPELVRLQQQILAQAPELASPSPPSIASEADAAPRPKAPRLPPAPHLVGRDGLLAELAALAASERLITLTGAGGSGKTVLALALVHRLAPAYPDGARFVDLSAVTRANQVLPAIAAALGLALGGTQVAMGEFLAERRMVLLFDNLEHVLEAVPDLAPIVAAGDSLVVATSRAPLGLKAEFVVPVPPLPPPSGSSVDLLDEPAVELFIRAARSIGSVLGADPEELNAIGEICRHLDGLPLAIEIAASQARVEDVRDLAAHLAERLPQLRAGARDAPSRQRTVEAAIRWSYDQLPRDRRRAFTQLAVFAGSFDAIGAAAVTDEERTSAIAALTELMDASLIIRQPPIANRARFRLLAPIRSVARWLADPLDFAAAVDRHANFVAAEIDRLCPSSSGIRHPEDLAHLRAEHADLLAALEHLARSMPDRCVDLLVQLDDYWIWSGAETSAMRLIEELLERGELSDRGRCQSLALRLGFETRLGFDEGAEETLTEALSLAVKVGDEATSARVRLVEAWWAVLAVGADGQERARLAALAAVEHARRSGNRKLMAETLGFAGWLQSRIGDATHDGEQVERWLEEALDIVRRGSMAHAETLVLRALTNFHGTLRRDPVAAAAAARSALDTARRFDSPERAAWYAINVGVFAVLAGAIEEGRTVFLSALRTDDRIGHRIAAMYHVMNLALVESATGRWRNALILYAATESVARSIGAGFLLALDPEDESALAAAAEHLGASAAAEARAVGARMTYREAVDFAFEINGVAPTR